MTRVGRSNRDFRLAGTVAWLLAVAVGCNTSSTSTSNSDDALSHVPVQKRTDDLLSEVERKYIWDIEHLAFVLEQKVFPILNANISSWEPEVLAEFLANDFIGHLGTKKEHQFTVAKVVRVREFEAEDPPSGSCDARAFLEAFATWRGRFGADASQCEVSFGVVRLNPKVAHRLEGAWQSVWRLRMSGRSNGALIELVADIAVELGHLDDTVPERRHWITLAQLKNLRIIESDQPLMVDVSAGSGINVDALWDNWDSDEEFVPNTGGVYVADYDRDGVLDVLVEDIATGAILYRGNGDGSFVDVTDDTGLPRLKEGERPFWTLSCWGDLDSDGDADLISLDRIFENRGDGTFRDVTDESNLLLTPAAGYALGDYNLDGKVDIYVCHTNSYRLGQEQRSNVEWIDGGLGIDNVLWENRGDWQFADVTSNARAGGDGTSTFSAVWFDANDDRYPDLLAINEFGQNSLLLNDTKGGFTSSTLDPVFGGFSMGLSVGDVDNNGHSDIYVANMYSKAGNRILANVDDTAYPSELYAKLVEATRGNKLYTSRGDGRFDVAAAEDIVADVGWAYGSSLADFDGDGWLDIYATAGFKSEERGKPDG